MTTLLAKDFHLARISWKLRGGKAQARSLRVMLELTIVNYDRCRGRAVLVTFDRRRLIALERWLHGIPDARRRFGRVLPRG